MTAIIGIGADLIEVSRVTRAYERFGGRFLERLFTPEESAYCMARVDYGGRPTVELSGVAATLAAERGVEEVMVTISHEKGYAMAFAVALGK